MFSLSRSVALLGVCGPLVAAQDACWDVHTDCPHPHFEGPSLAIDGKLYVFGGFRNQVTKATSRIEVYDPAIDSWSSPGDMPALVTHVGVELDGRTVWMVGGFVGDHPGVATTNTWFYDVDLQTWTAGPALPKSVAGGALIRYDRSLHWFGGVEADRDTDSADHFVLDLDDPGSGWSSLAPLPEPRNHLAGALLGERIHAIGGQFGHDTEPVDTDRHHAYDPATDTWVSVAPLPIPRSHFEAGTMVHAGKAIILSGRSSLLGETALIDVTEYSPTLDSWSALPPLPEARLGMAAKVIQDRIVAGCGADFDLIPKSMTISRPVDQSFDGHMRVNCGGPHYVDTLGRDWCSDVGHRSGGTFENDLVPDVLETDEDELYLTHRTADDINPTLTNYRVPADAGKYRLVLHFAEIFHGATGQGGPGPGQRELRVVIEESGVLSNLDVAAEVGVETAMTVTFDFEATDGSVDFRVLSTIGTPMLAAYELITLSDDAFDFYCSSGPNSTGEAAQISFRGSSSLGADNLRFVASPLPNGQFGIFFYSQSATDVAFGNGRRCVDHPIYRLPVNQISNDTLAYQVDFSGLPNGGDILVGSAWHFQAWFRDPPAGGSKFDTSDALRMTFTD